MAKKMLAFTKIGKEMPEKRLAGERVGDFHEIYADYIAAKAEDQASRCSQCGVPFCQVHCPLHNSLGSLQGWLGTTPLGQRNRCEGSDGGHEDPKPTLRRRTGSAHDFLL